MGDKFRLQFFFFRLRCFPHYKGVTTLETQVLPDYGDQSLFSEPGSKSESQLRRYKGRGENRSAQSAEVKLTGLERTSQVQAAAPGLGRSDRMRTELKQQAAAPCRKPFR